MNKKRLEHVVIRRQEYVSEAQSHPDTMMFVESKRGSMPIKVDRLESGQIVGLKWMGGPIVARGHLESWDVGQVVDGDTTTVREYTLGSPIYDFDKYWITLKQKIDAFVIVIRIKGVNWLDSVIYPRARSYGSTWIYLDSPEKRDDWLNL